MKTARDMHFPALSWGLLKRYLGLGGRAGAAALDTPGALGEFLDSRAGHVAQTTLYGYLKTRAGTRFPELFEDPAMLASINIAKWHLWLACLSDVAVYSGVLMRRRTGLPVEAVREMLGQVVARTLDECGAGQEAGDGFAAAAGRVRGRIAHCDLDALLDDDSAFTESPRALLYWAPVVDELKRRDAEIVRNSVRFRWQEVRRDLRRRLRAHRVAAAAKPGAGGAC